MKTTNFEGKKIEIEHLEINAKTIQEYIVPVGADMLDNNQINHLNKEVESYLEKSKQNDFQYYKIYMYNN